MKRNTPANVWQTHYLTDVLGLEDTGNGRRWSGTEPHANDTIVMNAPRAVLLRQIHGACVLASAALVPQSTASPVPNVLEAGVLSSGRIADDHDRE